VTGQQSGQSGVHYFTILLCVCVWQVKHFPNEVLFYACRAEDRVSDSNGDGGNRENEDEHFTAGQGKLK